MTKDRKLAWPMGLKDCGLADCTDEVESLLAASSHLWVGANLTGFRTLFSGGDGYGMDDLLTAIEHDDLNQSILQALDAADSAAAAMEFPLNQATVEQPEALTTLHNAIAEVTTLLKGDVATLLLLQIPSEAAGDND